jgi:transglutaminase-like putative cysteine protease
MIRLRFAIDLSYEVIGQPADFIFNIHAAPTSQQAIRSETLSITPPLTSRIDYDPLFRNRLLRLRAAPGPLKISYQAEVDIRHHVAEPASIGEMPIAELPTEVLPFLYPSRYCESDKLQMLASQTFGLLPRGYERAAAICKWVNERTKFTSGSSNFTTSALDTYVQQTGVCRDFAHLMIALCRALNMPARFSSGLDYGADPALGPTDFHAYVEVFLDARWYIFDPSGTAIPMGFVRIGTGRDAADISFATIFGSITSAVPVLRIEALDDAAQGYTLPTHSEAALSTDTPVRFTEQLSLPAK